MSRYSFAPKKIDGPEPEKRYNIDEAVEILGLCKRSIYQARKEGILPYSQKCRKGHIYFVWEDFVTYWQKIRRA